MGMRKKLIAAVLAALLIMASSACSSCNNDTGYPPGYDEDGNWVGYESEYPEWTVTTPNSENTDVDAATASDAAGEVQGRIKNDTESTNDDMSVSGSVTDILLNGIHETSLSAEAESVTDDEAADYFQYDFDPDTMTCKVVSCIQGRVEGVGSIEVPTTVEFDGSVWDVDVDIPNGIYTVTAVGTDCFSNEDGRLNALEKIILPNTIESVEYHAIYNLPSLTCVEGECSSDVLEDDAIDECPKLGKISFQGEAFSA